MIILHGGFCQNRFLLWGEKSPEGGALRGGRRGRKPKKPLVAPLPFATGQEDLTAALQAAGLLVGNGKGEPVVAWLPTAGALPRASSALIAEPPANGEEAVLTPWVVTVLALAEEAVLELLRACAGAPLLATGIIAGRDLIYWSTASRFAGSLVARQQFLPAVKERQGGYYACWQPVMTGTAANQFVRLAGAMPRVCRALLPEPSPGPPQAPAGVVLLDFVSQLVDWLVRANTAEGTRALSGPTSGPKPRGRSQKNAVFDSPHDQWLHALVAVDGLLEGDQAGLAALVAQVGEWQRRIAVVASAPFRLCFRLEEPEEEGGKWQIRYLLQSNSDPSLILLAQDVWRSEKNLALLTKGGGAHPREYLLAALGQASGVCPPVEGSLRLSSPDGFELDSAGAYLFLTDQAVALEMAGFGVLLPAWWIRNGTKLRLSARAKVNSPKLKSGGGLSLEDIVHVDWEVAMGDEVIPRRELEALAKLKSSLVKIRGQWVQLSAGEIQAALDFLKRKAGGTVSVREVVHLALGAGNAGGAIACEGVDATGWVAGLIAQMGAGGRYEDSLPPPGLLATLRPYQVRGYSWLAFLEQWGFGACLADDMGLGKTVQTLALLQRKWSAHEKRPALLVCPTSLIGNWQREAARFTPELPVSIHHGPERITGTAFKTLVNEKGLVITSYGLLHRDLETLRGVDWSGVILDEAQNIKNAQTMQARAARSFHASYRIALTGTPVENNVGDLWSVMEFLNPGLLGSRSEFHRRFFLPIQAERDPRAAAALQNLTRPFLLRRLKSDKSIIADLPEKQEMKVYCTLTREQASLYASVVAEVTEALATSDGIQRKGLILGTLSKLKQVCNHPAQFLGDNAGLGDRSGKLARLGEMLEEVLANGEKALVFTQFAEMGELLKRYLQGTYGREVLFLHGGLTKQRRDQLVERFQAGHDGPPVFILSLKAGGTGLNLTNASHVFHFDRWWNPAAENQATDRAYRIGQTRNVQVYKFLCAGTLEEKIDAMIDRKQKVVAQVIGTGEGWLTELSTTELIELFALEKEAVRE